MTDAKEAPRPLTELLAAVRAAFPDLTWSRVRSIDGGWDHQVIVLDERLLLRFPNEQYYRDVLPLEIDVLRQLDGTVAAAVPRYTHVARDGSFAGYPLLPGEPLTRARFDALPHADRRTIAVQLAEVLTAMHTRVRIDGSVALWNLPEENEAAGRVARERLPGLMTAAEVATALAILDDARALVAEAPAEVLLHGDVYADHLLWDGRRPALIDWSDLAHGDPAVDLADLGIYGRPFLDMVLERYGGPADPGLRERAERYARWLAVFLLTDSFRAGMPFAEAREAFDRLS
ncbi:phosphotransferase [Amnibacterium sp. CER49]|uniref:phosphotransferase family protein n=1 Tax=Amnibacterium sp. CER49 TaxID=3039161 RepID=UPI00244CFBA6|nr:phosphotransferase [Amnibacterium sp. CER49]MDH2444298.1 phosphotransferase [Amnibacterium sp. CER49]